MESAEAATDHRYTLVSLYVNCNPSIGPKQIHWQSPGERAERLLV